MTPKEFEQARATLGLRSQQAMADAIGMSRDAVSRMERGTMLVEMRTELAVWCLLYEAGVRTIGQRTT